MKKVFLTSLSLILSTVFIVGCAASGNGAKAGDTVKTGLAVISSIEKSKNAGEADGLAEVDSVVAAVTVGSDGKIVKCVIDAVQTKVNFTNKGKITTDLKPEVKTKQELGTAYGMKKQSGIGKEWNEQANAFAAYCTGKTIDQIKGIVVNDKGAPTDKELSSSVTISIGDFKNVVEKAVKNAQAMGAKAGDKLGLGVTTSISGSKDYAVTNGTPVNGTAQAYSYYTATTFDGSGKITSCIIDSSQSNVQFDAAGKIVTDLKAPLQTKNELGTQYGMAKASSIKKEWNEQAQAFAQYVKGKTVDQISGIAVNEKGAATSAELTGSVTISIANFKTILQKAATTAK